MSLVASLGDIFTLSFLKTPEEKRAAELASFGRKTENAAFNMEIWFEDAADEADKVSDLDDDEEDLDKELDLPVWKKQFELRHFNASEITREMIKNIDGLQQMDVAADELEAQLTIKVEHTPRNTARITITLDPNKPYAESNIALAAETKSPKIKAVSVPKAQI